jgi:hypothetical protein
MEVNDLIQKYFNKINILNKNGKYNFVVGVVRGFDQNSNEGEVIFSISSKKKELYRVTFNDNSISQNFRKIDNFLYFGNTLEVLKFKGDVEALKFENASAVLIKKINNKIIEA